MATPEEASVKQRRGGFSRWASKDCEEVQVRPVTECLDSALTLEKFEESFGDATSDVTLASSGDVALVEKGLVEEEKDAIRQYSEKFGECRDGTDAGYNRTAFPWFKGPAPKKPDTVPAEVLEAALASKPKKKITKQDLWEVDSEGEEVPLCTRCSLPVGEFSYQGREGRQTCVHTECMAQILMQDRQQAEDNRAKRENAKKQKNRREYDIGWRMESVPKNAGLAERMGCTPAPQGLCCLVLDEASRTVKVAATLEPSAAINLEYLLLALKVRKTAKREPLFSLDPVDPHNLEKTPQKKVYEPSWLAGTSVGDVMFQADYFLKELALGEYSMPVVGMLSVFDWSEMTLKPNKAWAGREWFVVRKAEVRMAEDNTLIPHVKMGVEAREQVVTHKGLEDAAVTLPQHPLKKFADAFTRNFDLIAERKSVVFHLRELAKASVMAKYLIDSKARLDPTWYQIADEIVKATEPEAYPEIPQLWNMRGNSRIQLRNGKLVDVITGGQSNLQAIYGGVEFGLDRFELAQRHALQGQQKPGVPLAQSGRPLFMPQRFQLGQRAEMPQGVDLNLDKFSLSTEERFVGRLPPCSGGPESLEARTLLGKAFLQSLQQQSWPGMKEEDQKLLVNLYNVPQCDRTQEGDSFIPPDPNMEYVTKVRNLVGEEDSTRGRRKLRFAEKTFSMANPGPEFPRTWTSRFQVETDGHISKTTPTKFGLAKLEVDASFEQTLLNDILPMAAPEFNKITEDGVAFRIYKIGSLEVRTIQEAEGPETVCVVFSSGAASWDGKTIKADALKKEMLARCKIFVEAMEHEVQMEAPRNYYTVLETKQGNAIVTEILENGEVSWVQNPNNLEDRNSLAKLLFQVDCKEGISVQDVFQLQSGAQMERKQYAKSIYKLVAGRTFRGQWGGQVRRYAAPPSAGISLGNTSEFLNVMWLARHLGSELHQDELRALTEEVSARQVQVQDLELELAQMKDAYASLETQHHLEIQELTSQMEEANTKAGRAMLKETEAAQDLEEQQTEVTRLLAVESTLKAALEGHAQQLALSLQEQQQVQRQLKALEKVHADSLQQQRDREAWKAQAETEEAHSAALKLEVEETSVALEAAQQEAALWKERAEVMLGRRKAVMQVAARWQGNDAAWEWLMEQGQGAQELDLPEGSELRLQNRELCLSLRQFKQDCELLESENLSLKEAVACMEEDLHRVSDQHARLVGHVNHRQKIRYTMKLKEEINRLCVELKRARQRIVQLEVSKESESLLDALASLVGTPVPRMKLRQGRPGLAAKLRNPVRPKSKGEDEALRLADAEQLCILQQSALDRISMDFQHLKALIERTVMLADTERRNGVEGGNFAALLHRLREIIAANHRTPQGAIAELGPLPVAPTSITCDDDDVELAEGQVICYGQREECKEQELE
ncbi:Uncharacterized protein SCF082_LOCUS49926 [Durusdinium trenchii]|uniref:Hyaluronan-mediated motility receptor C-terminal domain-containing protein n=1 Tax=Durusdinium trenchii TaxID=1381693 RepID=A0ABP0S4G2_9DINO